MVGQNARGPILHGWRFGHPFLFCHGSLRTWVAFFHSYQHILIPRKDMRNFAPIPFPFLYKSGFSYFSSLIVEASGIKRQAYSAPAFVLRPLPGIGG